MSCRYITFDDRKKFEELYAANASFNDIATALGVHLATVYREFERGNTGLTALWVVAQLLLRV